MHILVHAGASEYRPVSLAVAAASSRLWRLRPARFIGLHTGYIISKVTHIPRSQAGKSAGYTALEAIAELSGILLGGLLAHFFRSAH